MKQKTMTRIVVLTASTVLLLFGMIACVKTQDFEVTGYAPVYGNLNDLKVIQREAPKPIVNAGKIYQYGIYTFQIENGEGIHVINSSDLSNPQKVCFIKVKGCSEISIKNNMLFTDNYQDLVGINIADLNNISISSRLEKVFPGMNQEYPPVAGVYFECTDASKGIVIGWTEKLLTNPKCKR